MEKRELTCISCPMGCQVTVELERGEVQRVYGNTCPRGDVYARKEVVNPTRIVTSTVVVTGGERSRLSVKTKTDIPKDRIFAVMEAINAVKVPAPVAIGEVILRDVAGTGADVVATRAVEAV